MEAEVIEREILTLPASYYQREVSIRKRMIKELMPPVKEGWNIIHHFGTAVFETYDDNIYQDADNEIDDFVTTIIPAFRLDILTNKLYFNSICQTSVRRYYYLDDELFDHSIGAKITYQFSPRIKINFQDMYTKTNSLTEIEGIDLIPTGHTVDRMDSNSFFTHLEYDLIRGGNKLWLDYNENISGVRNHGRNNNISSKNQLIGIGFTHSFTRRTSVSPGLTLKKFTNRKSKLSDYEATGVRLGFEHAPGRTFEFSGNLGAEYRDYKNRSVEDEAFNADIQLTKHFSRRTRLEMDYNFDTLSSYASTGSYDMYRFGMGVFHDFTPFLNGSISGIYSIRDYEGGSESDTFSLGIRFRLKQGERLLTALSYRFDKKNATEASSEYTDNVFMITVSTIFW